MDYEFQEFPKGLYRDEGEYLVVADADEETAALDEGWRVSLNPLDHDGDGKSGGVRRAKKGAE